MARRAGDDGAAAVEFALVLPLLLLLVFGIVDFGRAYSTRVELRHAAREGVRVYSLSQDSAAARCAVRGAATTLEDPDGDGDRCTAPFTLSDDDIDAESCAGNADFGEAASVTVSHQFDYLTPLPGLVTALLPGEPFEDPVSLTEEGTMRCGG